MKSEIDRDFFGKVDNMPEHLKPVVEMATKDATILIMACIIGEVTSV